MGSRCCPGGTELVIRFRNPKTESIVALLEPSGITLTFSVLGSGS